MRAKPMQIEYTCRNMHLDDRLRGFIEQKLQKVMKFVEEPIEVKVLLDIEKHRHIAEVHISHRLGIAQATEETGNLQDAVNLAVDKAEKQVRRFRKKLVDKRRRADRTNGHRWPRWPMEVLDSASVGDGATPRVVETTHVEIKPMTIAEAAIELETAEHGFVVFRDADTDRLNVLFRRKDQNYGLIAPEP
jgi:putative sigma-54 modulation protein